MQKKYIMIELRIKECCKKHNILVSELAYKMGYEHVTSLNQLLRRRKIGLDKLELMAELIGCKVTDLFTDETETDELTAFVKYKNNHYTADSIEELNKIVEEINQRYR